MKASRFGLTTLILIAGCGSGSTTGPASTGTSGGSCTATLSGPLTQTVACAGSLQQEAGNTGPDQAYVIIEDVTGVFNFEIRYIPVGTGHYGSGDASVVVTGAVTNVGVTPRQEWDLAANNPNQTPPDSGTYAIDVTQIAGTPHVLALGQAWDTKATLDATYSADPSSAATGTVTVHVDLDDKTFL